VIGPRRFSARLSPGSMSVCTSSRARTVSSAREWVTTASVSSSASAISTSPRISSLRWRESATPDDVLAFDFFDERRFRVELTCGGEGDGRKINGRSALRAQNPLRAGGGGERRQLGRLPR